MKILFILFLSLKLCAESWSVVYCSKSLMLKTTDIKNIYFKKMKQKKGQIIIAFNLSSSHKARRAFLQKVLDSDFHNWDMYYDEMYFAGVKAPPVLISIEAMRQYLSKIDGSIGYLPTKGLDSKYIELARFNI